LVALAFPLVLRVAQVEAKAISIAEARRSALGTTVTVEGAVTVPSGTFKSSISDEGFAVQDKSGGIYVRMSVNLALSVNERVRVTGRLAEKNGLLAIVPESVDAVRKIGRSSDVAPQKVSTGKINETTEGRLVRVKGMITRALVPDAPYGTRVFINDGTGEIQVYVSASAKIDLSRLHPGQRVRVVGFSGQYQDHYEVEPRFQADILPLSWKRRPPP
jgi:DNA/RNA endonuclease YhcR with UshA esterase domain